MARKRLGKRERLAKRLNKARAKGALSRMHGDIVSNGNPQTSFARYGISPAKDKDSYGEIRRRV